MYGNGAHVGQFYARIANRFVDDGKQLANMGPRRDFGNDAAKTPMQIRLRRDEDEVSGIGGNWRPFDMKPSITLTLTKVENVLHTVSK